MSLSNSHKTYAGGCHCGRVRFTVKFDLNQPVYDCNCSICRKKGFLHLIVPPENFTLLTGKEQLNIYTFNTGKAKHTFCKVCGISSFYYPRSHPNMIDVNLRCLDENIGSKIEIVPFDGANWEANVDKIT